jgi:hypothetical protein
MRGHGVRLTITGSCLKNGAGEGNRTLTWGLESLNSAIKLHPHLD